MGPFGRSLLLYLFISSSTLCGWSAPRRPSEHVVQPGQTLAKIAKRYQLSLDDLCEANDLKRSATLKPGLRLAIPNDDDDGASAPRSGRHDELERSMASVGRGSGTSQKIGLLRNAAFSRYLTPPAKRGWVHVIGHHGEFKGQLLSKTGKLQQKSVVALSKILAWPRTDFLMDKRLLMLLTKVSDAFGGRTLRAVSGYRTTSYVSESKHPLGRACDFFVLGVPNTALRDYARTFNDVGVGYYPNSTFVHLDVRDYDAYWVDYAGPGEPPRYRNESIAKRSDVESKTERVGVDDPENERELAESAQPDNERQSARVPPPRAHGREQLDAVNADADTRDTEHNVPPLDGKSEHSHANTAAQPESHDSSTNSLPLQVPDKDAQ